MTDKKDKGQGQGPKQTNADNSPFLKAAAEPPAEETPEEKAQREAREENLKKAIEYTFQLQEKINDTLTASAEKAAPVIDSMQRAKEFAIFMGEWAKNTRQERDAFYNFLETSTAEIMKAVDGETAESITSLKEYLFEVWYDLQRNPDFQEQFADISLPELLKPEPDANGETDTVFRVMLEQAKKRREAVENNILEEQTQEIKFPGKKTIKLFVPTNLNLFNGEIVEKVEKAADEIKKEIPSTVSVKATNTDRGTDMVSLNIWKFDELKEGENQLQYDFPTLPVIGGAVKYSVRFGDLEELEEQYGIKISRKITPYDKRVYEEFASLTLAGNKFFTMNQLGTAVGHKTLNKTNYKKLRSSLYKMRTATLFLSNQDELDAGGNYPEFYYDSMFLPFDIGTGHINGRLEKDVIFPLKDDPPILSFARKRGQITTIKKEVLHDPEMSLTDREIGIQGYLLDRIASMKKLKRDRDEHNAKLKPGEKPWKPKPFETKILFKTLYKECKIPRGATPERRTRESVAQRLEHFKKTKYIKGFRIHEEEYIEIALF